MSQAFSKIWILIILIILIAGGIFAWQYFSAPENKTADWKTYTFRDLGFEIKLPLDWDTYGRRENTTNDLDYTITGETVFLGPSKFKEAEVEAWPAMFAKPVVLSITKGTKFYSKEQGRYLDFEEVLDKRRMEFQKGAIDESFEEKQGFLNSHSTVILSNTSTNSETGEKYKSIEIHERDEEIITGFWDKTNEYYSIFDQILSTFKFVEEDEESKLKVYRDEKNNFEFRYPKDFLFSPKYSPPILHSYLVTDIEGLPIYDLQVEIYNIEISAYEDAQKSIRYLPAHLESSGPNEKQINNILVYLTSIEAYGGVRGVFRAYFFPEFILRFSYANTEAEGKLQEAENQILSTFQILE